MIQPILCNTYTLLLFIGNRIIKTHTLNKTAITARTAVSNNNVEKRTFF